MDAFALVLGVASVLLALAGAGKILSPRPTASALRGVGIEVPESAVRGLGALELVLGIAAAASGAAAFALGVGVVYLGFTAFVLVALQRAVASCGCFGATGATPSWGHVALNVALATGSVIAGLGGARSMPDVVADHPVELVVLVVGVVGAYLLLSRQRDATPVAAGTAGEVDEIDLRTGRTALVFLSTTCLTCREIWAAFATLTSPLPGGVRPVIVTKNDEPPAKVRELAPEGVTTVQDSDAWERYGVSVAPAVVLVDDGEVVTAGLAASWQDVLALAAP